jgi:hypothetical protein
MSVFNRDFAPATSLTELGGSRNQAAMSLARATFAAPSAGTARTRTIKHDPVADGSMPSMPSCREFGVSRTLNRKPPSTTVKGIGGVSLARTFN